MIEAEATGASDSMKNIGQDTVRRLPIPATSVSEQDRIVALLDEVHHKLRRTVSTLQLQIGVLGEKRQALITTAITGQIAIPGAA